MSLSEPAARQLPPLYSPYSRAFIVLQLSKIRESVGRSIVCVQLVQARDCSVSVVETEGWMELNDEEDVESGMIKASRTTSHAAVKLFVLCLGRGPLSPTGSQPDSTRRSTRHFPSSPQPPGHLEYRTAHLTLLAWVIVNILSAACHVEQPAPDTGR